MKSYLKISIGILNLLLGFQSIFNEYSKYDVVVFEFFNYLPFTVFVIISINIFLSEKSAFKIKRNIFQFSFSIFNLAICIVVLFAIIQRMSIDNAKTILRVSNKAGAKNVWQFDLKENSNFVLTDRNLLGHTIYHGKYLRTNDTLIILSCNYNETITQYPMIGIIKNDTVYWNQFDTMLIDKNN
jgi:hypothetical protein